MDKRTKILAGGFGAVVAFLLIARVVYPGWIRPLMTIDDRVQEKKAELAKLEELQDAVNRARIEYRDYVARIGSFDFGKVETSIRDRLNVLIEKHKLENANTAPSRPVPDRKTGLTKSVITVSAVASLESAINFMRDLSELPELVRLGNPTLSPASSSGRRGQEADKVNIRVPIDVLVLPKNKTAGSIDPATLTRSDSFVRHAGLEYSQIWERTPFTPFVELQPLRVDVQRMLNVEVGQPGILQATASGGDGNYTYTWSPAEGLTEPNQARTNVDTSAPRTQTYTVSVMDTVKNRQPVTASVAVNIKEPKPRDPTPAPVKEAPQPVVVAPPTWPDAKFMTVVMTLLRNAGTSRTNELMVTNSRTKETTYHKVMDDFDGGKLVYVHQTGGVVWRGGKYYVYPLGSQLADCMEYQLAEGHPELKAAAERAVALETARAEAKKKATPADVAPAIGPQLDSRGSESQPAGPVVVPPVSGHAPQTTPAEAAGPVVPAPTRQTEEAGGMGPPDQVVPDGAAPSPMPAEAANPQPVNPAPANPAAQNPQNQAQPAQPGAQQPPRQTTPPNRPRPKKGKGPGRV